MTLIKAQSPAGFAEEYIVTSIWNGKFAPGSILPAERELSELIGVTRTTLREVLQRLSRDGWLTIQHGKPTKVNNFWETSGLSILETLAQLDQDGVTDLVDQLLAARTNISAVFIRGAIKTNPQSVLEALDQSAAVPEDAKAFAHFDYRLNHAFATASANKIYVLTLNGFRGLYSKIASFYFSYQQSRDLARAYYAELRDCAAEGKFDESIFIVRRYGVESGKFWDKIKDEMPKDIAD
ncbi:MAG: GntR family negative regulator for fad regulon and positive regulator of fabA [Alteromonadaceae bacterium]|jgi:GntR family negative regulator for fad regulon and positive regulator of fabA